MNAEEKQALIEHAKSWIADAEGMRDDIPFGFDDDTEKELSLIKVALAALTAEPTHAVNQDSMCISREEAGPDWEECLAFGTPLYTKPPVAALVLPSELEPASEADCDELFCDGYNACLDEVKRLNASAPAEEKK